MSGSDEMLNMGDLHTTFIRNVDHELRTPLTIVQGYAELLSEGEMGALAPEQQQALTIIVNRAYALRTLVDRIGVLMQCQAHAGAAISIEPASLVEKLIEARRSIAEKAGLTLQVDLQPPLAFIEGDPSQLQNAIDCLLENAIKFTPSGGRVTLAARVEPGWICFSVTDTGVGIPEDKLSQLFRGFYQVDGSETRRYGGIGLGLTLVKAVAEAHRGQIDVTSQPGAGSCFTLRLPLATDPHLAQISEENLVRRILVVDDEAVVAWTLQDGLEKLPDCQVSVATSGEQALDLFRQQPFDLLITDYKMPGTDGMTLAGHVRRLYPNTAIILITAYSSDELREQAARASIHHILDKPVKLAEIRSTALKALEQPGA